MHVAPLSQIKQAHLTQCTTKCVFFEITLQVKTEKIDAMQLFYDLLIININSSSSAGRIKKKPDRLHVAPWAVVCPRLV